MATLTVLQCDADTTFLTYVPSVVAAAAIICSLEEVTALQSGDLLRIFGSLSVDVVREPQSKPRYISYLGYILFQWSSIFLTSVYVDFSHVQDAVEACYYDMQEVVIDSYYRRLSVKRKALCASEPQSPVGVLEAAALSSASEGTSGFSSRESSPGVGDVFPVATSSRLKRRKLLADDEHQSTTTWLQHTHL
jgi:cyclin D1/2/4